MANGYFQHNDPAMPGTKVASAQFNNTMLSVQAGFDLLPTPQQFFTDNARYGVATSAATNVYNLSLPQIATAFGYVTGMGILVKFPVANTGPAQINVNGLGLKEMRTPFGQSLSAGDLTVGTVYDMRFDGVYFQVLNAVDSAFTAINRYVLQAQNSAALADFYANDTLNLRNQTGTIRNNATLQYNQLAGVVASLPSIPAASYSVQGTTTLSDVYTSGASASIAMSTQGAADLYAYINTRAPTVHTHTWSQITNVPQASPTQAGVVQLYAGFDSDSTTLAATASAAASLYQTALGKALYVHTHTWSQITNVPQASTSQAGVVQLSDDLNSSSTTLAATANAARQLNILISGKAAAIHSHTWAQIDNVPQASTTQAGVVLLADNLTTSDANKALTANQGVVIQGLLNGKANTQHTHTWSQITNVPQASNAVRGTVQLYDGLDAPASTFAATANAAFKLAQMARDRVTISSMGGSLLGSVSVLALVTGTASMGTTHPSSDLLPSNFDGANQGALPAGQTWQALGYATGSATATPARATLFVRIA